MIQGSVGKSIFERSRLVECREDRPRVDTIRDCSLAMRYGAVKKKHVTALDLQRKHVMVILERRPGKRWAIAKERRAVVTTQPKRDMCMTVFPRSGRARVHLIRATT